MQEISEKDKLEYLMAEIRNTLSPGDTVRTYYLYTSIFLYELQDGDRTLAVYKNWNKCHQEYDYRIDDMDTFLNKIAIYKKAYMGNFGEGREMTREELADYSKTLEEKINYDRAGI